MTTTSGDGSSASRGIHGAITSMLASHAAGLALVIVGFTVMSRLLDPSDFGAFAVALAIYSVMQAVAAFGLGQYIVQAKSDTDLGLLVSITWMSMSFAAIGAVLCLGLPVILPAGWISAPVAAALAPLALALILEPVILSRQARLERGMAFRRPAIANVSATIADVTFAIIMALVGFSAIALSVGLLAGNAARAVIFLWPHPGLKTLPRTLPRIRHLRAMGRFGSVFTLISLLPKVADLVLLSGLTALAGAGATGVFNRAQKVRDLLDKTLFDALTPVMLPSISAALRDGVSRDQILLAKLDRLAPITWPGFAMIALLADPLVRVLMGEAWEAAIPAVQILAIGGLASPFLKMALKYFTAIGQLNAYLRIQLVHIGARIVLGVAGAMHSLEMFCLALVASNVIKAAMTVVVQYRDIGGFGRSHLSSAGRSVFVTFLTLLGPAIVIQTTDLPPVLTLIAASGPALLVWPMALWLTRNPLLSDIVAIATIARRRRVRTA